MVKRLVEKFRRDIRAPGMADFKGPYSYRAYEMYLYGKYISAKIASNLAANLLILFCC